VQAGCMVGGQKRRKVRGELLKNPYECKKTQFYGGKSRYELQGVAMERGEGSYK